MAFYEGYTFDTDLMIWKWSRSSYILAVVFYCQVYFTILLQHAFISTRSVWPSHRKSMSSRVQRKLLKLLDFDWEVMKVHVDSGCGVGDGLLERKCGKAGRHGAQGCMWGVWMQDTCRSSWIMLPLVLAPLHMEMVFGLAHLEVGVYLEFRPISNNILSEVIAGWVRYLSPLRMGIINYMNYRHRTKMIKAGGAMGYQDAQCSLTLMSAQCLWNSLKMGDMFLIDCISKSVIWRVFDGDSGHLALFLGISLVGWAS